MDIIFNTRSSPLIDRILHCETKYNAAAEQMTSVGYILRYVTLTFLKKHIAPPFFQDSLARAPTLVRKIQKRTGKKIGVKANERPQVPWPFVTLNQSSLAANSVANINNFLLPQS